jgi:hypothetical protein
LFKYRIMEVGGNPEFTSYQSKFFTIYMYNHKVEGLTYSEAHILTDYSVPLNSNLNDDI